MTEEVTISPEAQAIYAGHKDLLDTAQALDNDVDILLVREKVVMKELNQLRAEIRKKLSERQACLAVAQTMLEYTPAGMRTVDMGHQSPVSIYHFHMKGS